MDINLVNAVLEKMVSMPKNSTPDKAAGAGRTITQLRGAAPGSLSKLELSKLPFEDAVRLRTAKTGPEGYGERLHQALMHKSLGLRQFGSRIGMSAAMLSQHCKGRNYPQVETLNRIATALNLEPEMLFPDYEHEPIPHTRHKPATGWSIHSSSVPGEIVLEVNKSLPQDIAVEIMTILKRADDNPSD